MHQQGRTAWNATAAQVPLASPFESPSVDVRTAATWQLLYDTGTSMQPCLAVSSQGSGTLCQRCASHVQLFRPLSPASATSVCCREDHFGHEDK